MRRKITIIVCIVILVVFGRFLFEAAKLTPVFFQLLFSRDIQLKKNDHSINILLLGVGGAKHEGPDLTDTVIFTSIDPTNKKAVMVSIPRDLWVPDLKTKINVAYADGESKKRGGGLILAKAVVAKILHQPIDYAIRVDFDGFINAIDLVGGIDVDVERSFSDPEYPVVGKENDTCGKSDEEFERLATSSSQLTAFPCRYMTVSFEKGRSLMNGETALQFVRSRHANGVEGTDFARSKRQEKVISGFKDKVFSLQTFFQPGKLLELYSVFQDSIDTDIKQDEYDDFIRLAQGMKDSVITSLVLDDGDGAVKRPGLLVNPPVSSDFEGQWVLIPRVGNGNYSEIHKYIECGIKSSNCVISQKH